MKLFKVTLIQQVPPKDEFDKRYSTDVLPAIPWLREPYPHIPIGVAYNPAIKDKKNRDCKQERFPVSDELAASLGTAHFIAEASVMRLSNVGKLLLVSPREHQQQALVHLRYPQVVAGAQEMFHYQSFSRVRQLAYGKRMDGSGINGEDFERLIVMEPGSCFEIHAGIYDPSRQVVVWTGEQMRVLSNAAAHAEFNRERTAEFPSGVLF